jgi:hypothetical protein
VSSGSLADALTALTRALDELGSPSAIIGGVAVIANGVPRATVDVDATVSAQAVEPERLAAVLARHDILPRMENAIEFARAKHVFLAEHRPSRVAVDVSLAWLPFGELLVHGRAMNLRRVRAVVADFAAALEDGEARRPRAAASRDRPELSLVLCGVPYRRR